MSEVVTLVKSTPKYDYLMQYADDIVDSITEGQTLQTIAGKYDVSESTLQKFLTNNLSARVNIAYRLSAEKFSDMARIVLEQAQTFEEIARARELASHYRYEAKIRNRNKYGDKVELEHKTAAFTPDMFDQLLQMAERNISIDYAQKNPDNAGLIESGEGGL